MCVPIVPPTRCLPTFLPLPGPPPYLRHNTIEIMSTNNITVAQVCPNERKHLIALTLNQKLEMIMFRE